MRSVFQLVVSVTATSALLAAVSCSDDREKSQGNSFDVDFNPACDVYCDHMMELSCWTADVSRNQCLAYCENDFFGGRYRGETYACTREFTEVFDACPYFCETRGGKEVPLLDGEMCSEFQRLNDCMISHRDCEMCEQWGGETYCSSVNCEDCLAWPGRYSCQRLDCEVCGEADVGGEYCWPIDCERCQYMPGMYSCHER